MRLFQTIANRSIFSKEIKAQASGRPVYSSVARLDLVILTAEILITDAWKRAREGRATRVFFTGVLR